MREAQEIYGSSLKINGKVEASRNYTHLYARGKGRQRVYCMEYEEMTSKKDEIGDN